MKKLLAVSTIKYAPLCFIALFTFTFSLFTHSCSAQYTDLIDFTGTSGSYIGENPSVSLTLSGATLYGTTFYGGIYGAGNIFSVQTNGTNYKDLIDFTGSAGSYSGFRPNGSLTLSGDTLYGTTEDGGISGIGNIFSVQTNGTNFKDLVEFTGTSGSYLGLWSESSLTLSGDTLYGMTRLGGINDSGNIFSVQTNGTNFKDLVDFTGTSGSYIGYEPFGSLILVGSILYGMTSDWGLMNGYGNIFSFKLTSVTTSVNPLSAVGGQLKVYPNPNNGIFTVVCHSDPPAGGEESMPILQVYNVLGENILTETLRSAQGDNTVDISSQPSGVYLYRVLTETGGLIGEGKVTVQK